MHRFKIPVCRNENLSSRDLLENRWCWFSTSIYGNHMGPVMISFHLCYGQFHVEWNKNDKNKIKRWCKLNTFLTTCYLQVFHEKKIKQLSELFLHKSWSFVILYYTAHKLLLFTVRLNYSDLKNLYCVINFCAFCCSYIHFTTSKS